MTGPGNPSRSGTAQSGPRVRVDAAVEHAGTARRFAELSQTRAIQQELTAISAHLAAARLQEAAAQLATRQAHGCAPSPDGCGALARTATRRAQAARERAQESLRRLLVAHPEVSATRQRPAR